MQARLLCIEGHATRLERRIKLALVRVRGAAGRVVRLPRRRIPSAAAGRGEQLLA